MTRYARVKRDRNIQEANSTPWSVLIKKRADDSDVTERRTIVEQHKQKKKHPKSGKLKRSKVPDDAVTIADNYREAMDDDSSNQKCGITERTNDETMLKVEASEDAVRCARPSNSEEAPSKQKKMKPTGANCIMSFQELSKVTQSLLSLTNLEEVKRRVRQLWRDGNLEKSEAAKLIRRWRSQQWQEKHNQNREKLIGSISTRLDSTDEQTLDDVKLLVNKYVAAGKITHQDAGFLIKRWRKRESRRIKRQLDKGSKSCCFYCRQTGHKLFECPEKNDEMMGAGICFKCGSTEHTSSACPRRNVRGYPYATCFICRQQGHLSRDCDKNANGIYPDGGSCNLCGSQKHLKKDCPLRKGGGDNDNAAKKPLITMRSDTAGGDDDVFYDENGIVTTAAKKEKFERKIVRI